MIIDVDQTPFQQPDYASQVNPMEYATCLSIAGRDTKTIYADENRDRKKLVNNLRGDPNYEQLVASVIRTGTKFHGINSNLLTVLAERLAHKGEVLEINDHQSPKATTDPQGGRQVWIGGLSKGTVIYRGDVYELGGLKGGTVCVEGNVTGVHGGEKGVVYIQGDVEKIVNTQDTVVIVTGKIGNYANPTYRLPLMNTAYVIASETGTADLVGQRPPFIIRKEDEITCLHGLWHKHIQYYAVTLCARFLEERANKALDQIKGIQNLDDLVAFNKPFRDCLDRNNRLGYYAAPRPDDD